LQAYIGQQTGIFYPEVVWCKPVLFEGNVS
jgi:hypothetical protein